MLVLAIKKNIANDIKNSSLFHFTGRKLSVQSLSVEDITINVRLREKDGVSIVPENVYDENILKCKMIKEEHESVINIDTRFLIGIEDPDIKHDIERILLIVEDLRVLNKVPYLTSNISLVLS